MPLYHSLSRKSTPGKKQLPPDDDSADDDQQQQQPSDMDLHNDLQLLGDI